MCLYPQNRFSRMWKFFESEKGGTGCLTVLLLSVVLIGVVIGGILLLDVVGVVSKERDIYPLLSKLPVIGKNFLPPKTSFERLKEEELRKLKESIKLQLDGLKEREEELNRKEGNLVAQEADIKAREEKLLQEKQAFEDSVKEYEKEEKKWGKLVSYYQNMKPDVAGKILSELDDQTVIEIFRRMKESQVAITLMKMDPKRAAEISRKMGR